MNFAKTKNGYSEKEVNDYISLLDLNYKKSIAEKDKIIDALSGELNTAKQQEKSIAIALTAAVDKAKEIETSSKNIYRLKIEQMTILCSKWEVLLNEMIRKYPGIEDITNVREDINNLKSVIKNALKDDFNIDLISKNPVTDPIRILLSRLGKNDEAVKKSDKTKPKVIVRKSRVSASDKTELSKLEERANQIKPIVNLNLKKDDKFENLVDKFLNTDEEEQQSNLKNLLSAQESKNQEKFDLNEAVNPTEDLDEIMKAFDFYNKKK